MEGIAVERPLPIQVRIQKTTDKRNESLHHGTQDLFVVSSKLVLKLTNRTSQLRGIVAASWPAGLLRIEVVLVVIFVSTVELLWQSTGLQPAALVYPRDLHGNLRGLVLLLGLILGMLGASDEARKRQSQVSQS